MTIKNKKADIAISELLKQTRLSSSTRKRFS